MGKKKVNYVKILRSWIIINSATEDWKTSSYHINN
jgi:hypothetical protein